MKEETRNAILKRVYPLIARVTRCGPVARYPWLYFPYARRFRRPSPPEIIPWTLPARTTQLVVEEPGSCGNHSFAAYFIKHNPDAALATLTHSAAPVRYAVKHGIPCIVLMRDMIGYVRSSVARFPHLYTPKVAVLCYTSFYKAVLPFVDDVVLAGLHEIVADPRTALEAVNDKYGTSFNVGDGRLPRIRATVDDVDGGYETVEGEGGAAEHRKGGRR